MKFPFLRAAEIEAAAGGLLLRVFGTGPIAAPVDLDVILFDYLAEEEGLSYDETKILGGTDDDEILGAMLPVEGRIEISQSLRVEGPYGRFRFTVAHEIGHWVLHRALCLAHDESLDLFDTGRDSSRLISLKRDVFPVAGVRIPTEEWQANIFASHLLMPAVLLRDEFDRRFGPLPIGPDHSTMASGQTSTEVARRLARSVDDRIPESLCDTFSVSAQAMSIALATRGYVTDHQTLLEGWLFLPM